MSDIHVSFPNPLDASNTTSEIEAVNLGPLLIRQDSGGASPAPLTATLVLGDGGPSAFEAQFFGTSDQPATEIAGRFRFRTAGGMSAIGSFGASLSAQPQ